MDAVVKSTTLPDPVTWKSLYGGASRAQSRPYHRLCVPDRDFQPGMEFVHASCL
jgi:hypothetical protein